MSAPAPPTPVPGSRLRVTEANRRWWTLGAMCLGLAMIMLDTTVVNLALPTIQQDFDASLTELEWVVNAYTLAFAVFLVTGGRLGDLYGRRRMFLVGVVVFAAASLAAGVAPDPVTLIAARAAQGVGAALMMPGSLSLVVSNFPPPERGKAIGTWAGVSGLALALGPLVGGPLTQYVSWRAIFFLNLPVAAVAVVLTLRAARESRDESSERVIDIPGIVVLSLSLAVLVLTLMRANDWGWGSTRTIVLFACATAGLVLFAFVEQRVRVPMLQFGFFRSRTFLGANIAGFVITFGMFGMLLFIGIYLQRLLGYGAFEAGLCFLPLTIPIMLTGPVAGRLADRIGSRPLMASGLTLVALALFLQTRISVDSGYPRLVPAFILMGCGIGLTLSPMSAAALSSVDRTKTGAASGILATSRQLGGTFGIAVVGAVFASLSRARLTDDIAGLGLDAHDRAAVVASTAVGGGARGASAVAALSPQTGAAVREATKDAFVHGLTGGLAVAAALSLVGVVTTLVLVRRPPAGEREAAPRPPAQEPVAGPAAVN